MRAPKEIMDVAGRLAGALGNDGHPGGKEEMDIGMGID